jgi:hypothetical protein
MGSQVVTGATFEALFADSDKPLTPRDIYYGYAVGHQKAIDEPLKNIGGTWGLAARLRLLVLAIAAVVMTASLSVVLGVEQPTRPARVIIDPSTRTGPAR